MNDNSRLSDPLRLKANKIANGDWHRAATKDTLGKLDFVSLEDQIYAALLEASAYPSQATHATHLQGATPLESLIGGTLTRFF